MVFFFFSSRRRHTRCSRDWSSDVCSSDLEAEDFDGRFSFRLDAAAPLAEVERAVRAAGDVDHVSVGGGGVEVRPAAPGAAPLERSEEHTSELQSRLHLVCRLLLEKKKKINKLSSGADLS